MKKTAVAGYMGSGKSTLAGLMSTPGVTLVDADSVARELIIRNDTVKEKLRKTFGKEISDNGNILFDVLGRKAFGSMDGIKRLNRVVHPELIDELFRIVNRSRGVILDCALVSCWKIGSWFDRLVWVEASHNVRFERLRSRQQGLQESELENRMQIQENMFTRPPEDKQWIYIYNDGSIDNLREAAAKAGLVHNSD